MTYKIFELDTKVTTTPDGYYVTQEYTHKLKDVTVQAGYFQTEHKTEESAREEIKHHSHQLTNKTLTIIPIIHVQYDGAVVE